MEQINTYNNNIFTALDKELDDKKHKLEAVEGDDVKSLKELESIIDETDELIASMKKKTEEMIKHRNEKKKQLEKKVAEMAEWIASRNGKTAPNKGSYATMTYNAVSVKKSVVAATPIANAMLAKPISSGSNTSTKRLRIVSDGVNIPCVPIKNIRDCFENLGSLCYYEPEDKFYIGLKDLNIALPLFGATVYEKHAAPKGSITYAENYPGREADFYNKKNPKAKRSLTSRTDVFRRKSHEDYSESEHCIRMGDIKSFYHDFLDCSNNERDFALDYWLPFTMNAIILMYLRNKK